MRGEVGDHRGGDERGDNGGPAERGGRTASISGGTRVPLLGRQEITEVEVLFEPVAGGTRVTVTHAGWEKVSDSQRLREGYGYGLKELLGWYREAGSGLRS